MFISNVTRKLAMALVLSSYLCSSLVSAEPDQQSGKRRGPPPEAIEACVDQSEGESCSFSGHRGDVTGTCIVLPHDEDKLACAPEGGPGKERSK